MRTKTELRTSIKSHKYIAKVEIDEVDLNDLFDAGIIKGRSIEFDELIGLSKSGVLDIESIDERNP